MREGRRSQTQGIRPPRLTCALRALRWARLKHVYSSHPLFYAMFRRVDWHLRRFCVTKNGEQVSLLPLLPGLSYSIDPIPIEVTLSVTEVLRPVRRVTCDIADDTPWIPKTGTHLCTGRCSMAWATANNSVRRLVNLSAPAHEASIESAQIRRLQLWLPWLARTWKDCLLHTDGTPVP